MAFSLSVYLWFYLLVVILKNCGFAFTGSLHVLILYFMLWNFDVYNAKTSFFFMFLSLVLISACLVHFHFLSLDFLDHLRLLFCFNLWIKMYFMGDGICRP